MNIVWLCPISWNHIFKHVLVGGFNSEKIKSVGGYIIPNIIWKNKTCSKFQTTNQNLIYSSGCFLFAVGWIQLLQNPTDDRDSWPVRTRHTAALALWMARPKEWEIVWEAVSGLRTAREQDPNVSCSPLGQSSGGKQPRKGFNARQDTTLCFDP